MEEGHGCHPLESIHLEWGQREETSSVHSVLTSTLWPHGVNAWFRNRVGSGVRGLAGAVMAGWCWSRDPDSSCSFSKHVVPCSFHFPWTSFWCVFFEAGSGWLMEEFVWGSLLWGAGVDSAIGGSPGTSQNDLCPDGHDSKLPQKLWPAPHPELCSREICWQPFLTKWLKEALN